MKGDKRKMKKYVKNIFFMLLLMMLLVGELFPVQAKSVCFAKTKISMTEGSSYSNPLKNTKKGYKVSYKSGNTKIATVNTKGTVKARKEGKTIITATYRKKKYKYTVTVKKKKNNTKTSAPKSTPVSTSKGKMTISYIDVGQASCSLISSEDGHNILVDTGNDEDSDLQAIEKALNDKGIKELDYVVLTHYHEDHIGTFRYLPARYKVNKVFLSSNINQIDTKIYQYTMNSIQDYGIDTVYPKPGEIYKLGDMQLSFVGPISPEKYDDENANSLVFVLKYGEKKFLFGGDSTKEVESDILKSYPEEISEIDGYLVNHHGSTYSNGYAFIRQMTERKGVTLKERPFYAFISCAENNTYFHPHKAVLERLEQAQALVYRTDKMGTITLETDGNMIKISTEKNTSASTEQPTKEKTYIGNINSKIVHNSNCSSLPMEKNRVYFDTIEQAVSNGYKKCSKCMP